MDLSNINEEAPQLVSEYDPNEDRKQYIERMENEGYKVIVPNSNELFIDIDTNDDYAVFQDQIFMLFKMIDGITVDEHVSRHGLPGKHITVTLPFDVSDSERIAWQASLGSDYKRELLSMIRLTRGDVHPTLFVENK